MDFSNLAVVVASIITERPVCAPCIAERAHVTVGELVRGLQRLDEVLDVTTAVDRCRVCSEVKSTYSVNRGL